MNTLTIKRYLGLALVGATAIVVSACGDETSSPAGAGGSGSTSTAGPTTGPSGSTGATGSTGSGAASSGAASSAEASSSAASTGTGQPAGGPLIDDMEDGNGSIAADDGRVGAWYTYNDATATGTQTPAVKMPFMMTELPEPRDTSKYAANSKGSGFTVWGAGFGFDLNNSGTTKSAYDASKYTGITFWAKVGTGSTTTVRFNIGDKNTTPEGGVCMPATCSDDFGQSLTLTESWQQFTIKFADMKAENWSKQNLAAIDKSALYAVHFQAGPMTTFDIWVDDISFVE